MQVDESQPGIPAILARHWLVVVVVVGASIASAVFYLRKTTPVYTSSAKVYVQPTRPRLIGEAEAPPVADDSAGYLNSQRAIVCSTPVLTLAMNAAKLGELKTFVGQGDPLGALRSRVRAAAVRKESSISIEFDSPYPPEATKVVNAVVAAYLSYTTQQRQAMADELLKALRQSKADCDAEITAKRSAMLEIKQSAGAGSLDDPNSPALRTLQSLKDAATALQLEMFGAEAAYADAARAYQGTPEQIEQIEQLDKTGGIALNTDAENATLRTAIAEIEQKIDEQVRMNHWLPKHPQIQGLQTRLNYLRALYVVATKRRVTLARAKLDRVQEAIADQQSQAQRVAEKGSRHAMLDSELKRLEKQSDTVEERIRQVKADTGAATVNIRVIEDAVAGDAPTWPRRSYVFAAAGLVGLVLGTFLACLREWTDGRLRSADQARALRLPLLGIVPHIRRRLRLNAGQVVKLAPLSDVAEGYRSIRASLRFAERDGGGMKILITSPVSGEGKSTITSNLAIAVARSGRRVLVLDADFRHPTQHRIFGLTQTIGLGNALMGDEPVENVIQRTEIEGLDVIPCGSVGSAASEALAGHRFGEVLAGLGLKYDMILIDSPPIEVVSDAKAIASLCDAVALVVRVGKTDLAMAARACDGLLSLGVAALGLVVNDGPRARRHGYSYCEPLIVPARSALISAAQSQPARALEPIRLNRPVPRLARSEPPQAM